VIIPEPCYNLLERGVVLEFETIPKGPLGLAILGFGSPNGLRETKEWKRKVNKSVLVIF
jgi:hypothetical protein